jgi:uncharacterized protein YpuA (DUF1002 family)
MTAKKTTIADAEKRVIRAEIKTLTKIRTKVTKDATRAVNQCVAEIAKTQRNLNRIVQSEILGCKKIDRRLAILEARL